MLEAALGMPMRDALALHWVEIQIQVCYSWVSEAQNESSYYNDIRTEGPRHGPSWLILGLGLMTPLDYKLPLFPCQSPSHKTPLCVSIARYVSWPHRTVSRLSLCMLTHQSPARPRGFDASNLRLNATTQSSSYTPPYVLSSSSPMATSIRSSIAI